MRARCRRRARKTWDQFPGPSQILRARRLMRTARGRNIEEGKVAAQAWSRANQHATAKDFRGTFIRHLLMQMGGGDEFGGRTELLGAAYLISSTDASFVE